MVQTRSKFGFGDSVKAMLILRPTIKEVFLFGGIWTVEHRRRNRLIDFENIHNVCTSEGLTNMENVMFHQGSQAHPWYVLIFEDDVTPADGTTYATPVFQESSAYDEATRPEYLEGAAASKVITNASSKAVFTMSGSRAIYGAGLVGGGSAADTKLDVAGGGVIFAAAKFASVKNVEDDDTISVTYALTGADA